MRFLILALLLLAGPAALAQYSVRAVVRDSLTHEVLVGVSGAVRGTSNGGATDVQGQLTLDNISGPTAELVFSYLGYRVKTVTVALPQAGEPLTVLLGPDSNALEEVVVTSTRTNSRIEDLPTRIEVLGAEELEEESGIKPGNVASILGDVASIQIQPTSATTGNADLRIQGLQGKYTQILRDGLPLFGGYAGSFGILQIPPLDLRQVEIIKGASSTLYGGGAIAGMINLISKEPQLNGPERTVLANISTLRESNLNGFFSGRNEKVGYTLFVGGTRQQAVDVNGDGYSDVPRLGSVLIHPRLFLYPTPQSKLVLGYTGTYERRRGGDMQVLREQPDATHQFFINNDSWRHTADARYDRTTAARGDQLVLKGSLSSFQRNATTNTTGLNARQLSYYTEGSQLLKLSHHDVVLGANVTGESFRPVQTQNLQLRAYDYVTPGLFAQDDWKPTPAFTLQSGLRIDHHNRYGTFVLPRLSALLKIGSHFSSRLGGGLGYKAPSFFVNELDERDFARVLPFTNANKAERSTGANWDVNYTAVAGQGEEALHITINQSFFLTQIQHPLLLNTDSRTGFITFSNAAQPFLTRGFETYVRVRQDETELYLGYVFTDARRLDLPGNPRLSLIARDKLASVLSREFNEHWRAGLEAAYTGRQHRDDGPLTPGYLFLAGMVRYSTGPISFVLNGENLLDYRQTRKETIWSGDRTNPTFRQLWAPIEGRVINLSATAKF
ncbi:TonB-dependent receptor [Hymenobacter taeanensis]|uniref:TonB-dependent receptor n=1 Tax=Hymenobacter taeanensis TaxID=2735321 RepID=A0A6M6BHE0_9BACT|nr:MULTISPECIES: TonB-dependent receptor [Hymenobacter]QJX47460.1 TonB-dependent receptor [Hymenobacter taeanensis]UOQ83056.1 TonB-dependent receptor [Hymenobacter sp. 5414T-23]